MSYTNEKDKCNLKPKCKIFLHQKRHEVPDLQKAYRHKRLERIALWIKTTSNNDKNKSVDFFLQKQSYRSPWFAKY